MEENVNKLSQLSNLELEFRLKDLVTKERKLLHVILEHIKEVETRRLYLERAYPSIYEFLVKELGYSGSAAMRRLEAARLLKEVPAVAQKIQEGLLNLSQIGELSRAIKEKEKTTGQKISALTKTELVVGIAGKNMQETQKEISLALDIRIKEREKLRVQKDDSVRLEITLSKDQYQKLFQCKEMAAHLLLQNQRDSSWASVVEVLADQFLSKKRLVSKYQSDQDIVHNTDIHDSIHAHESRHTTASETESVNKTLTAKIRLKILMRDKCCQFKDPQTGRQCGSKFGLQIDHRTSRWAGGDHSEANLQVLCRLHNQMKYRQEAQLRFV